MYFWTFKCRVVVAYIIKRTNEYNERVRCKERVTMPVMRINLLLYFIQVEYIKRTGKCMFSDKFYAFPSGPAIPCVYDYFMNINEDKQIKEIKYIVNYSDISDVMKKTIDYVLEHTYCMDAIDLSLLSRVFDGPWDLKYEKNDIRHRQVISKKMIEQYYGDKELFSDVKSRRRVLKK